MLDNDNNKISRVMAGGGDCPIKSGNDTKGIKPDNNAKGNTLSCTPPSSSHKRHSFLPFLS